MGVAFWARSSPLSPTRVWATTRPTSRKSRRGTTPHWTRSPGGKFPANSRSAPTRSGSTEKSATGMPVALRRVPFVFAALAMTLGKHRSRLPTRKFHHLATIRPHLQDYNTLVNILSRKPADRAPLFRQGAGSPHRKGAAVTTSLLMLLAALCAQVSLPTPPVATKEGDGAKITFSVSAPTDVEVAILSSDGSVVRHLAAGALGSKGGAAELLQPGLSQSIL